MGSMRVVDNYCNRLCYVLNVDVSHSLTFCFQLQYNVCLY